MQVIQSGPVERVSGELRNVKRLRRVWVGLLVLLIYATNKSFDLAPVVIPWTLIALLLTSLVITKCYREEER